MEGRFAVISVSDAAKILEQIPIWKQIRELPKRIAELERRVAALEQQKSSAGRECPMCGAAMKVKAEHDHPQFAFAGLKIHDMECECGNNAERVYDPGKGYR
jgi:hypothetical protein